ncbi:hypothetical protein EJ02DRAFT_358603, partial [Clathrospora elynae]
MVLKAFKSTGIWPIEPEVILKRFTHNTSDKPQTGASGLGEGEWRRLDCLVRSAVKDTNAKESKDLSQSLHHLQVQNELLHYENSGLR